MYAILIVGDDTALYYGNGVVTPCECGIGWVGIFLTSDENEARETLSRWLEGGMAFIVRPTERELVCLRVGRRAEVTLTRKARP